MKSNKQRFNDHMSKQGGGNNGGSGGEPLMWIIIFIAIFALLYSTKAMWESAIGINLDDLTVGEGKPNPDADAIGKMFR